MEAIFLCTSGRSHRTSKDSDLMKMGSQSYYVEVGFIKELTDACVEVSYQSGEKKKVKINEVPVKKIGNLMGHLNTVIFSPEDLFIIKEGPSERRRFIDITISQIKPSYFYDLQQYMKVLFQRNALLKEIQYKRSLIDTLEIWNNNLIMIGSRIIKIRKEFINRLNGYIKINHSKLTNGKESLFLEYSPSIEIETYENIKEIEGAFRKALEKVKNKELIKATTLLGPQRDDYEIILNDMNLKHYGSQGQQRTAVLSVKLSEIDIIKEETGEYPVILLDDVLSELDKSRQEYLLENLKGIQTFITCTENIFENENSFLEKSFLNIKNGEIIKIHD